MIMMLVPPPHCTLPLHAGAWRVIARHLAQGNCAAVTSHQRGAASPPPSPTPDTIFLATPPPSSNTVTAGGRHTPGGGGRPLLDLDQGGPEEDGDGGGGGWRGSGSGSGSGDALVVLTYVPARCLEQGPASLLGSLTDLAAGDLTEAAPRDVVQLAVVMARHR